MPSTRPSLRVERALQRDGHQLLAGMDEVGRGALAGPVSVGVVVIDPTCRSAPAGVKDSKLLTPLARQRLVPPIRRWAHAFAIGHAGPDEIDRIGIIAALRLAGRRALAQLPVVPDLVLLDGNHDWLTDPSRVGLLGFADPACGDAEDEHAEDEHAEDDAAEGVGRPSAQAPGDASPSIPVARTMTTAQSAPVPPVTTMIKADLRCSSVAAASVLAKVERDAMMVELGTRVPSYGWRLNKGYSCPEHFAALREHGPSEHHRRSWRLLRDEDTQGGREDAARAPLPERSPEQRPDVLLDRHDDPARASETIAHEL